VIKLLADANIEKGIVDCLLSFGFDVKWIPDYNCEMDDADLLIMANNEKRIIITNDKDFGELTFLRKQNSVGIILIRVKGQNTKEKVELIEKLILNYKEKIPNHFSIITKTKFRFISLEDII
jgi:predicted nuclease of predicted toxin-antitoxin system